MSSVSLRFRLRGTRGFGDDRRRMKVPPAVPFPLSPAGGRPVPQAAFLAAFFEAFGFAIASFFMSCLARQSFCAWLS
jgi:hypothetical protein